MSLEIRSYQTRAWIRFCFCFYCNYPDISSHTFSFLFQNLLECNTLFHIQYLRKKIKISQKHRRSIIPETDENLPMHWSSTIYCLLVIHIDYFKDSFPGVLQTVTSPHLPRDPLTYASLDTVRPSSSKIRKEDSSKVHWYFIFVLK